MEHTADFMLIRKVLICDWEPIICNELLPDNEYNFLHSGDHPPSPYGLLVGAISSLFAACRARLHGGGDRPRTHDARRQQTNRCLETKNKLTSLEFAALRVTVGNLREQDGGPSRDERARSRPAARTAARRARRTSSTRNGAPSAQSSQRKVERHGRPIDPLGPTPLPVGEPLPAGAPRYTPAGNNYSLKQGQQDKHIEGWTCRFAA